MFLLDYIKCSGKYKHGHPEPGQPFFIYAGLVGSQIGKLGLFRILTYIFGKTVSQFERKPGQKAQAVRRQVGAAKDKTADPLRPAQSKDQGNICSVRKSSISAFSIPISSINILRSSANLSMVNGPPPRGDFP